MTKKFAGPENKRLERLNRPEGTKSVFSRMPLVCADQMILILHLDKRIDCAVAAKRLEKIAQLILIKLVHNRIFMFLKSKRN